MADLSSVIASTAGLVPIALAGGLAIKMTEATLGKPKASRKSTRKTSKKSGLHQRVYGKNPNINFKF